MPAKWGEITAGEILLPIRGELVSGSGETFLTGLCIDSREIKPGQLFWAIEGERFDGHDFIEKAIENGASGIVMKKGHHRERTPGKTPSIMVVTDTLKALGDLAGWWRQKHPIPVVAITGSVGKTTTKEMTAGILGMGAKTLKNKGSFNNLVGLPLTLFLLEDKHQRVVLELGMNKPGEIAGLTMISDPNIGVITNVKKVHLEGVGDIMGVARAKVELLEKMSPKALPILNGDDALLMSVATDLRSDAVIYGLGPDNEIRAEKIRNLGRDGVTFELRFHGRAVSVRLRVPGVQNVVNALAACAVAICLKEPLEHIVEGLNRFKSLKGRLKMVPLSSGATLVDDTYNSNPSSLKAAIDSIKALASDRSKVIVGLGEMLELGEESQTAHIDAGRLVAELEARYFFALGDHAKEMVKGAVEAGFPPGRSQVVDTHGEMEKGIKEMVRSGDLVLLKGSRGIGLEVVAEGLKRDCPKEDNDG